MAVTLGLLAGVAMVWRRHPPGIWVKSRLVGAGFKPPPTSEKACDERSQREQGTSDNINEERSRLAIEAANDGIWDWDIKGGTFFGSDRAHQLLGIKPGAYEWNYKNISRLIHPKDRKHFVCSLRQHLRTGELFRVELRLQMADGSYGWFMVKGKAIWDAAGKPTRMVGPLISINYRKSIEEIERQTRENLEKNVTASTTELTRINQFLKAEIRIRSVIEDALWQNIEKLHLNGLLLQNILDTLPVGVWVVDGMCRIVQANPAAKEIWGQTRAEFTPDLAQYKAWRRGEELFAPIGKPIAPDEWTIARAVARGESSSGEILEIQCFNHDANTTLEGVGTGEENSPQATPDGLRKTIVCWAVPLCNAQGEAIGAIAVFRDITELRQVEAALRRSEQELRKERNFISTILDSVGALVLVLDTQGRIESANRACLELLGLKEDGDNSQEVERVSLWQPEYVDSPPHIRDSHKSGFDYPLNQTPLLEGRYFWDISVGDGAEVRAIWGQLTSEMVPLQLENYWLGADGEQHLISWFLTLLPDANGQIQHIIAAGMDISDRERTAQIQASLERERELSQLQRRFFSMVSHEFRTPLSTILMSTQILQNSSSQWLNPKAIRNLLRIETSVLRALRLLDDIMTINQAETGRLKCQPHPIDLWDFCRQVVEEMEMLGDGATKIDWAVKAENVPQPVMVFLDEKLLRSILCNLLSNGLKYSPAGAKVEMLALVEPFQVVLRITDTGMGIAPADLSRLFEAFYRTEEALKLPGSGLGLTVVKKCVDLHRGTITVESQLGLGSIFTVTLPQMTNFGV
ncbi:MAG TPA: PAS domain S-box protein [Oscillatoriaceae cyanobacterium M33_DOE_052]|nr:PAS domain S-box protein [Oscillatoriaceae cyanobacterium M33_DOE_052]